jgi:hypothetical protein
MPCSSSRGSSSPPFVKAAGAMVPPMLPVSYLDSVPGAIIPFLLVACIVTPK